MFCVYMLIQIQSYILYFYPFPLRKKKMFFSQGTFSIKRYNNNHFSIKVFFLQNTRYYANIIGK